MKSVHFIGIGGIGMSAAAALAIDAGFNVSGSDAVASQRASYLQKNGAQIYIGQHSSDNLPENTETVIYSNAIDTSNPELVSAMEKRIPTMTYYSFLGKTFAGKKQIVIAGMHGKSTTTAMTAKICIDAGLDPMVFLGTTTDFLEHENAQDGKGDLFIIEGDEYKKGMLGYQPFGVVILNIEEEHMDCYKDLEDIKDTFRQFASKAPDEGFVITSGDDENSRGVVQDSQSSMLTFGTGKENDYQATDISYIDGKNNFIVKRNGKEIGNFTLQVPGQFNVMNALAAISIALQFSIPIKKIQESLSSFSGTWRRFEHIGEKNGIIFIDDYAHHPTEISATLRAARDMYPNRRIVCALQLHHYKRVKSLYSDFITAVSPSFVDKIIVTDFYFVKGRDDESLRKTCNAQMYTKDLREKNAPAMYISRDKLEKGAKDLLKKGDVFITMGAGDITEVGRNLFTEI